MSMSFAACLAQNFLPCFVKQKAKLMCTSAGPSSTCMLAPTHLKLSRLTMYSKRALRCVTQHLSEKARSSQIQCCTSSPAARIGSTGLHCRPPLCCSSKHNGISHDEQVSSPRSTVQERSPHSSGCQIRQGFVTCRVVRMPPLPVSW